MSTNYSDMPMKGGTQKQISPWFLKTIRSLDVDFIDGEKWIVALNKRNANIIENSIRSNHNYDGGYSMKIFEYHGGKEKIINTKDKNAIRYILTMIDFENSTNAIRYNMQSFSNLIDHICDPSNDFWKRVSNYDDALVDEMAKAAKGSDGGAELKSLSSKVCRFFNQMCYGHDDYYVWDSVIIHVINYYWKVYGFKGNSRKSNHKELQQSLEKIRLQADQSLTREELDHIMWYSYRYQNQ